MKKLLRWLGFHVHEWGLWEEYEAQIQTLQCGIVIGTHQAVQQRRSCKACGLAQRRGF